MSKAQKIVSSLVQKIKDQFGIENVEELLIPILDDLWDLKKQPEDHELATYLESLHDYSILYYGLNENKKAKAGLLTYLKWTGDESQYPEHYLQVLQFLSMIYEDEGDMSQAHEYYQEQYTFALSRTMKNSGDLAFNLGISFFRQEKYPEAIHHYREALTLPLEDVSARNIENALASALIGIGQYAEAESLLERLYEQLISDEQESMLITVCNNLGRLYQEISQVSKAIVYFEYAVQYERKQGESKNLVLSLNNLGLAHHDNGDHNEAYEYYLEAQAIALDVMDKDDVLMANIQNQLGLYCLDKNRLEEALEYFGKTKDILMVHGVQDTRMASLLTNMGGVYSYQNNQPDAITHYQQALSILQAHLPASHPELAGLAVNLGVAFAQNSQMGQALNAFEKARTIQLKGVQDFLPHLEAFEQRQYFSDLFNFYEIYINTLLQSWQSNAAESLPVLCYDLVLECKHFLLEATKRPKVSTKQISNWDTVTARQLQEVLRDELVIDLIRINKFQGAWVDESFYLAFLVSKNQIDLAIFDHADRLEQEAILLYWDSLNTEPSPEPWHHFWQPIAEKLPSNKRIWFSPDGVFSRINPLTLWDPGASTYLSDQLDLHFLFNVKELAIKPVQKLGDIKSMALYNPMEEEGAEHHITHGRKETEGIAQLFPAAEKRIYHGKQATIKQFSSSEATDLIHITTHGRLLDQDTSSEVWDKEEFPPHEILLEDEPLSLSTIDFSDANGQAEPMSGDEISQMKLQNTKLVVLSACQSSASMQLHGHGSFGLVRAFKLAGVSSIIGSLWPVEEEAAYLLMRHFYKHLVEFHDPKTALKAAQELLKSSHPLPEDWGAFVLFQ